MDDYNPKDEDFILAPIGVPIGEPLGKTIALGKLSAKRSIKRASLCPTILAMCCAASEGL